MDFLRNATTATRAQRVDQGLRSYMISVYNYMALALAITGLLAMLVGTTPALSQVVFGTGLMWFFVLAPLGMVFFLSYKIQSMSIGAAQTAFYIFSALMGISLGSVFLAYTSESIARTFFITAGTFGAMSVYGYTTKKDLSGWGSFLFMGVIGIIIAGLVNIFLQSSALQFIVSFIGVLVFTGLVAYDTQRIKEYYYMAPDSDSASRYAIMGALALYMDFINLFIHLLRFFGERK